MKQLLLSVVLLNMAMACTKTTNKPTPAPHPAMTYIDLKDSTMKTGKPVVLELTGDNRFDFWLSVLHAGDPILQRDRWLFYANSAQYRYLLVNQNEETLVLNRYDSIGPARPGYQWWDVTGALLTEKIMTEQETWWQGAWKDARLKYLPIQLFVDGSTYYGWLQLSVDTAGEQVVLHKAAICKEPGKFVQAGV